MCRKGEALLPGSPFRARRLTDIQVYCHGVLRPVLTSGSGFYFCACGKPVRVVI